MASLFQCVLAVCLLSVVLGHGRLVEPAGRSSAWRFGFPTPVNHDDDGMNCGGRGSQFDRNDGKCGICGDPWDMAPRPHEAGGKYATGTITKTYREGQVMPIKIRITTNHQGWFEFRLCPNNNIHKAATQQCLDQYVLPLANGAGTMLPIPRDMYFTEVKVKLPPGLTCSQCVLQWYWKTGNSWGTDPVTGESGMGLGNQEEFYGCSDIAIYK